MGPVRSLNLWLSLSRCGDVAPGLDLVPRRLDHLVAARPTRRCSTIQISQAKAEEAAGDTPIIRPIFEPGDALFFDELFLHQTASDPSMPNPRYAIESWFFGASAFPEDYAPIAALVTDRPVLARPRALGCLAGARRPSSCCRCLDAVGRALGGRGRRLRRRPHRACSSPGRPSTARASPRSTPRRSPTWRRCEDDRARARARASTRCRAIPLPDAVIVDGDHNYFTVREELRLIGERAPGAHAPAAALPRRLLAARAARRLPRRRRDPRRVPAPGRGRQGRPVPRRCRPAPGRRCRTRGRRRRRAARATACSPRSRTSSPSASGCGWWSCPCSSASASSGTSTRRGRTR